MANLARLAKSGSEWRQNELKAYNIEVVDRDEVQFFGCRADKAPASLAEDFMTYEFRPGDDTPDESSKLLTFLDLASSRCGSQESAVDDFAKLLLETLGYDSGPRVIRTRYRIPLEISGVTSSAETDVCVVRKNRNVLLLLQEDKTLESSVNPEPQVIAEAIAAFQENNRNRAMVGEKQLEVMTLPCITMIGTRPTFYLARVTRLLSECVMTAEYPSETTTVLRHIPSISRRISDGMKPLKDRDKVVKCLVAFRHFVDDLESSLSEA